VIPLFRTPRGRRAGGKRNLARLKLSGRRKIKNKVVALVVAIGNVGIKGNSIEWQRLKSGKDF